MEWFFVGRFESMGFGCETWEELLQECWEDGAFDDVVSCESIVFEEDKN